MSSNGNGTLEKGPVSPLLKALLKKNDITPDVAEWADQFPTPAIQSEALHRYRDEMEQMKVRIKEEMLSPKAAAADIPSAHTPIQKPHGRIGQALHSMEKFAAWDLLGDVEEWMSVKVPPYRYARRVFSWACTAFSVETVLAVLISLAMIYAGYRAINVGVKWAWGHLGKPSLTPTLSLEGRGQGRPEGEPRVRDAVPVFQITSPVYGDGNKLELHWPSQGTGYTYRVFAKCHPEDLSETPFPLDDHSVSGNGARVNMFYKEGCLTPQIQVMAILPSGAVGSMTDPVVFRLSPLNNAQTVEPIAMEATANKAPSPVRQTPGGHPLSKGRPGLPQFSIAPQSRVVAGGPTPVTKPSAFSLQGEGARSADEGKHNTQITSTNKSVSYISAFAKHLLNNAAPSTYVLFNSRGSPDNRKLRQEDGTDGAVASVVPYQSVSQGIIATKNAAMSANDATANSNPHPTPLPSRERESAAQGEGWSLQAPSNLKAQVTGPLQIRFTWNAVSGAAGYNFYSAKKGDPTPTKETPEPLLSPWGNWTSDSGPGEFRFAVRALDAQGRESANSNILQMEVQ